MKLETKFMHLRNPVAVGNRTDGWRVCWVGGWDRQRVFFVVMLVRVPQRARPEPSAVSEAALQTDREPLPTSQAALFRRS